MNSIKLSSPEPANVADAQAVIAPTQKEPIDFTISKEGDKLALSGNLSSQTSLDKLVTALGSSELSKEVKVNTELADANEVIKVTEELIQPFMSRYSEGSIRYHDGQLTVDGIVENRADKNLISGILASSTISSIDNTKVIKAVIEVPQPVIVPEVNNSVVPEVNTTVVTAVEAVETTKVVEAVESNITIPEAPKVEAKIPEVPEVPKVEVKIPVVEEVTTAQSEESKQIEAKIKEVINLENINFELDKSNLTTESLVTIGKIATILKENSSVKVEIGGHTDSSGNDTYNLNLSQSRVDSVKAELVNQGVEKERLTSIGYGETRPLVSNDTEENRRINRRVEFKIIGE
ncbi:MAG: OmpA family protein [Epsilonproteobacteria bacterium]|nr:OmpA family protein [Campylobacterota bacterium]